LAGLQDSGFTINVADGIFDLDDININSYYWISSGNPNTPVGFANFGIVHTMMGDGASNAIQRVYGSSGTSSQYKIWQRHDSGGWTAWVLIVDGGAFTQRLVGYADNLTHDIFTGDLDTLVINSKYVIAAVSVSNAPADFTSGRGFIDTDADSGSTLFTTQVLYGAWGIDNNYKQWMRVQDNGVWGAWVLVVDGAAGGAAVGQVTAFAQAVADVGAGWLYADGSAVSRTTYSALFAVLGDAYGFGDGSTTFNLPDYRGEILRGQDSGRGLDPDAGSRTDRGDGTIGDNVGTNQQDGFRSHLHSDLWSDNVAGNSQGWDGSVARSISQNTGSTGGNETRPVNIYVRYYIFAG